MTQQSRIDFWVISSELNQNVLQTKSSPAILTDHKALTLNLKMSNIIVKIQAIGNKIIIFCTIKIMWSISKH